MRKTPDSVVSSREPLRPIGQAHRGVHKVRRREPHPTPVNIIAKPSPVKTFGRARLLPSQRCNGSAGTSPSQVVNWSANSIGRYLELGDFLIPVARWSACLPNFFAISSATLSSERCCSLSLSSNNCSCIISG